MKLTRRRLRRLIEGLIMEGPGSGGLSAAGPGPGGGGEVTSLGNVGDGAPKSRSSASRKDLQKKMAKKRSDSKIGDELIRSMDFENAEESDMKIFVIMQPDKITVQTWGNYAEKDGEYYYVRQKDYKGADSDWKKLPAAGVKNIKTKYKDRVVPVVVFEDGENRPKDNRPQPGFTLDMALGKEKFRKA